MIIIESYNKFSTYLKKRYGEKVYKLPINIPATCPNRDGHISREGCIFCGEEGAGFETLSSKIDISTQLHKNMKYIGDKYKANKFIAYFQNYTNTYNTPKALNNFLEQACVEKICALYISTRPDCISNEHIDVIEKIKDKYNVDIVVELGLQSINNNTLDILNRGHSVEDFIDAVNRLHNKNIAVCTHLIVDLPWDNSEDIIKSANLLNELKIEQVKCHSLYVIKGTKLDEMYQNGKFKPISYEEFEKRTLLFLENLSTEITIQRLIGRAPKDRCSFCSWGMSWRKIQNNIEAKMKDVSSVQGKLVRV